MARRKDREQAGSATPRKYGAGALLKYLFGPLRQGQPQPKDSFEVLDEHEQSLRRLYPDGAPSEDGTRVYDDLVKARNAEVKWQLAIRRLAFVIALLIGLVVLALSLWTAWERFFG